MSDRIVVDVQVDTSVSVQWRDGIGLIGKTRGKRK